MPALATTAPWEPGLPVSSVQVVVCLLSMLILSVCMAGKHCQFPELQVTTITPTLLSHLAVVLASEASGTNNTFASSPFRPLSAT